ncbi:MAG: dihydrolipoamide acetyltransferase family protein [bacterium]
MRVDVTMPQLGESVFEGTLIKWHAKIGQTLQKDDILFEISTDKVDTEIPVPYSGKLVEIRAEEGDTVQVDSVIAVMETEEEATPETESPDVTAPAQEERATIHEMSLPEPAEVEQADKPRRFLSPLIRSIARQEDISLEVLEALPGTGKDGRLRKEDVLSYLEQRKTGAAPALEPAITLAAEAAKPAFKFDGEIKRMPMDHIRRSIAEHMVASAHTSPHVTSVHEVNVTGIMDYIEKNQASFRQREGVKLTPTAFVVQAAAKALKEFPAVNASIDGTDIIYHKKVNIGVAVALEQGLIVPVVRNADTLSISGISKAVTDLAARARTKKLNPDEVQGGTFSVTNFGVFDTVMAAPIINQPQVAILGMGSAKQRVVVVDGMIAIRWMMYLSLTYDHRLLDGAQGGQFLQRMTEILENVDG